MIFIWISSCFISGVYSAVTPDPNLSYLTGSGLRPDRVVLPCRYFFVHLRDSENRRLVVSESFIPFNVSITGQIGEKIIPIHPQILNPRNDAPFIVRYKTYNYFDALQISVTITGVDVDGSPITALEIYPSSCPCPVSPFPSWYTEMGCSMSEIDPQIRSDFEFLPNKIDMKRALADARSRFDRFPEAQSYCHYAIKDSSIYRRCFGVHVGFNMFVDNVLRFLTRVTNLPDVEFLINLGDWPLIRKDRPIIPMISWCKTDRHADVLLPTYDITESSLECMGRQVLDVLNVQGQTNNEWDSKIERGFWRGRDSRKERLELTRLSQKYPDLLDAGITHFFFFQDEAEILGTVQRVSFFDFFKYKYQINVDGTVAAYRLPYLLAGNSLVFKQDSEYYEHFYKKLIPGVHYIRFRSVVDDLLDAIRRMKNQNDEARKVSENGQRFVSENLLPEHIICYHATVLKLWSERLVHPVVVDESVMTKIEQDEYDGISKCACNRKEKKINDEL